MRLAGITLDKPLLFSKIGQVLQVSFAGFFPKSKDFPSTTGKSCVKQFVRLKKK